MPAFRRLFLATCALVLAVEPARARRYGASACSANDLGWVTCTEASFDDFVAFALEYHGAVTAVDFDESTVPTLRSHAFDELDRANLTGALRSFSAVGARLSIVEPAAFDGARSLVNFDLSYNTLTEITKDTFAGVTAPERIDVRHNAVARIEPYWLEGRAYRLKQLDLKGNRIERLENRTFAEIVNVERLDFSESGLARLDGGCFADLRRLRMLDLSKNRIARIAKDVLRDVEALEVLNLEHNELTELDVDTFALEVFPHRPALKELRLNNNRIERIPEKLFEPLSQLQSLHLQDNAIGEIAPRGLEGMYSIRLIDLNRNRFEVFRASTLVRTSPKELRMNNVGLREIEPRAFLSQGDMRTLDLRGNLLRSFKKDTFVGLQFVETLDLSRLGVETIEAGAFNGVMHAETLSLVDNRLKVLATGAFDGLKKLRTLNLTGNPIDTIESGAFRDCDELETIVYPRSIWPLVRQDCAATGARAFGGLGRIRSVNMTAQNLTRVPPLCEFLNAVELDLSDNRIDALRANDFRGLTRLETLLIERNPLVRIAAGAFSTLGALATLALPHGHARVATLKNNTFVGLASLETLDLSGLGVETVEPDAFVGVARLRELSLFDNRVAELGYATLEPLAALVALDVSYNRLVDVPVEQYACYCATGLSRVRIDGNLWRCARLEVLLRRLDALGIDYGNGTLRNATTRDRIGDIACTTDDDAATPVAADRPGCESVPFPNASDPDATTPTSTTEPRDIDALRRKVDAMESSVGRLFLIDEYVLAIGTLAVAAVVATALYRNGAFKRIPRLWRRGSNTAVLIDHGDS